MQLLIHGNRISDYEILIAYPGVEVKAKHMTGNPNYLFVDLEISADVRPGTFDIVVEYQREIVANYAFELKERKAGSAERKGFDNSDVIYLLMPDRFANGNPDNDAVEGMLEGPDRRNPNGRHGGDLQGIIDRLDHISELGATALWLNPVLMNNMPAYSYHGYAITDFYEVDPRIGSNEKYLELSETCHKMGIKLVMDMVFNHCGSYHWWMNDLPAEDWIHHPDEFVRSNYRSETIMDPYASEYDKEKMMTGWFDKTMPDLNQKNPFLANYLIQNSIWWIEHAGLGGIRMDTYPYSYQDFMTRWVERVRLEYPGFSVLGETWLQKEAHTAYFQEDDDRRYGWDPGLQYLTDFPTHFALGKAFSEDNGWTTGISRIYYVLSQDYLYDDPYKTVIFADNHDLTRFYTNVGEDPDEWKMALGYLLTTRGIPMIYYGTEILMTGWEHEGHGFIREDFPGGWPGDQRDAFTGGGRTEEENEAFHFLQKILIWRGNSGVVHHGRLTHYIPDDGLYVFFRHDGMESVMVIMNNHSEKEHALDWTRYQELVKEGDGGTEILSGSKVIVGEPYGIGPKKIRIIHFK